MNVVPDPSQKSRSVRLENGMMTFMSPELLIPEEFGKECAEPTPQSDIYAFGLATFQVRRQDYGYRSFSCILFQVLTGEIPFSGIQQSALVYHLLRGMRPGKPENASIIGFSDSLWDLTQSCWDREVESRPKVGKLVTHLREAAAAWGESEI